MNVLEYNYLAKAFIIHIDKKYLTSQIRNDIIELIENKNIKIILNDENNCIHDSIQSIHNVLSNFNKIRELDFIPDYIIFDEPDSLYVLPKSLEYIFKYDLGLNFSELSIKWQNKVFKHKSLVEFVSNSSPSFNLFNSKIKGVSKGIFFKYEIAQDIFSKLSILQSVCEKNKDFPLYNPLDFWLQLCTLMIEHDKDKQFKKTFGLTYMPWERKLQWTDH